MLKGVGVDSLYFVPNSFFGETGEDSAVNGVHAVVESIEGGTVTFVFSAPESGEYIGHDTCDIGQLLSDYPRQGWELLGVYR